MLVSLLQQENHTIPPTIKGLMFEQIFKNIDDVLWKESGCTTELDYTEQSSWMLFLKYLDDLEGERAIEAELVGKPYHFIIDEKAPLVTLGRAKT